MAEPKSMGRSVVNMRRVVVLPAPLGPRNPKISPLFTSKADSPDGLYIPTLASGKFCADLSVEIMLSIFLFPSRA